eukprot:CAMPEP_0184662868 /NCGR_PEP_ID=MMETSP0308-20130426/45294_1 /TAXON_ID=38269 /ORGANISM="Gloeochaete witrockiana, Strain SAG 46.84" /LENGTH=240 /DNA_ID=CAMNT_0027105173 /DNA_START=280 /DNA_END=1002 /DNA_ORIENTATION=+
MSFPSMLRIPGRSLSPLSVRMAKSSGGGGSNLKLPPLNAQSLGVAAIIVILALLLIKHGPKGIMDYVEKLRSSSGPKPEVSEEEGQVVYNYKCLKCGTIMYPSPGAAIWEKFMDENGELREDFTCTNSRCKAPRDQMIKILPKKIDLNNPPVPRQRKPEVIVEEEAEPEIIVEEAAVEEVVEVGATDVFSVSLEVDDSSLSEAASDSVSEVTDEKQPAPEKQPAQESDESDIVQTSKEDS